MKKPATKNSGSVSVKTFGRGLRALEEVCRTREGITQSELARCLGVDRSTALRFLNTLEQEGYVWRDSGGEYRPTLKTAELARHILENQPLRRCARGYLSRLAAETGLSTHLAVLSHGRLVYVDGERSPGMVQVNADAGAAAPLHCTATGKALAAYLEAPLLQELLASQAGRPPRLQRFTANTITDPAALEQELEQVRRRGYAVDDEEYEPGVRCLAAPIFNYQSRVEGVIGVSGTAARLTAEQIGPVARAVCRAADSISKTMGCPEVQNLREVLPK